MTLVLRRGLPALGSSRRGLLLCSSLVLRLAASSSGASVAALGWGWLPAERARVFALAHRASAAFECFGIVVAELRWNQPGG